VSASGYFQHQRKKQLEMSIQPSHPVRMSNEALLAHIKSIHAEVRGEYGWPRITKELNARGFRVGKERVRKLMQLHGIRAKGRRKFVVTTDSNHRLDVAPDLIQRGFHVERPNQVWTGDITYLQTDEGWVFLAVVLDLFSRQIVGWSMKPKMESNLVVDALKMAWFRRQPEEGLIFHSDRGRQYCSDEFKRCIAAFKMKSSMSRKGDCWDNAPTESLWGKLKIARLYGQRFTTRRAMMDEVMNWISFYNYKRLHSTLGYMSPMEFERRWYATRKDVA
jgi:putative transposase